MERDKELQRFPSPDGKRWIELRERPDGLFFFQEFYEPIVADPADETMDDQAITIVWVARAGWRSGLYERLADAQRDLKEMPPWLRGNSN
jgi:hypothetical protein